MYAKGDKVSCKHIVVYVLIDYHASRLERENPLKKRINRVGITVSKKLGKAVIRTRVRRIIREAYRLTDKNYSLKKGKLVVIVGKEAAITAKSTDVMADLIYAFKKLGMIEDKI